jgi:hypothetical protein
MYFRVTAVCSFRLFLYRHYLLLLKVM